MKKLTFLILLFVIVATIVNGQRVVRVGAFNFYPGIFRDTDGKVKGFYVDALKEIAEKENIEFIYIYGSWADGLERIKNGEVDMLTSVAYSEERAEYMDYASLPLLTVWGEVYITPSSNINGVLDLKGKTVAIMKGDLNGKHLQELTNKLAITCTFIEAPGFEDVFNLIVSGEVDAGVVNNTFGATKYQEFSLRSSGIILNPFDIFFTIRKNQNGELLEILNKYLYDWQHNRNSVYNMARQKWSHGKIGSIVIIPKWVENTIYLAVFLIVILILFVVLLRYKVKIATVKVLKSEAIFKAFMENTPAFVYIKDENLNDIYKNKMVESVVKSINKNELSSAKIIFEPHVAEMLEQTDRKVLNSALKNIDLQYFCKLKDKEIWLHDYKFYMKLPNEKPVIGGISFDITKIKETEQELIKAKEKAEESDRLKSAFLANMSHEIRTPMNGILGFAEILKEPDLTGEQQQECIEIIEKSGLRMLNIINNIVDISKIESGLMEVNPKESNIIEQMEYVYTFFKPETESKRLQLVLKRSMSAKEAIITTDREKVYAILTNLVKNAIKYTNEGSIVFGCDVVETRQAMVEPKQPMVETRHAMVETRQPMVETRHALSLLQFYVKDTGIGIPKDRQVAIFERFIQADISDKMARQGAGLGLSISKAYVEMLGGKIWVESEEGIGSTFYFTLPYNTVPEEKNVNSDCVVDDATKNDVKNLKILIAEDDETSEMLITIAVKKFGKEILKARTGFEAVEVCRINPDTDLILMDIQMPVMNGHEATRQIRQFNKDVVIIAQTAFGLSGDREKALAAGCNDYIAKPINKDELHLLIQKYFKK